MSIRSDIEKLLISIQRFLLQRGYNGTSLRRKLNRYLTSINNRL